MTIGAEFEFRKVADIGPLEALAPVAEKIFPAEPGAQRPDGWFARKVQREVVDPALSMVAVDTRTTTREMVGYCLVGAPNSLPGCARTAGVGVVHELHGRGIGERLITHAKEHAAGYGLMELRTVAEADRVGWYHALGFTNLRQQCTLLAFGRSRTMTDLPWGQVGPKAAKSPRAPEPPKPDGHEHRFSPCSWLREAWERTPLFQRLRLRLYVDGFGAVDAYISREGSALLVHRLVMAQGRETAAELSVFEGLLDALPDGAPSLFCGCDEKSPTTIALIERGWVAAQTSTILTLAL